MKSSKNYFSYINKNYMIIRYTGVKNLISGTYKKFVFNKQIAYKKTIQNALNFFSLSSFYQDLKFYSATGVINAGYSVTFFLQNCFKFKTIFKQEYLFPHFSLHLQRKNFENFLLTRRYIRQNSHSSSAGQSQNQVEL